MRPTHTTKTVFPKRSPTMFRTPRLFSLVLAVLTGMFLVAAANAEGPRRGPNPPRQGPQMGRMHVPGISGKLLGLLRIEEVRNELDLKEDQVQQLKDIAKMLRKGIPAPSGKREDLRNLPPEERRAKLEAFRKKALKHSEKFREQIKEVLTSDQFKRLEQIEFQVRLKIRGAGVLADKKLAEKLGITGEQKEKFRELRQQLTGEMREFAVELRNTDPAERAEKEKELHQRLAEVRKEVFKQAFEVLTYEQRETLEEMKGEPFELDLSKVMRTIGGMRMGPGGRPGGPGEMRRGPGGRPGGPGEMRRGPGGRQGGPGMQLRRGPQQNGPPREPRE